MKLSRLASLAAVFAFPALAHAHPGHDGHELTWDFASGAVHPLTGFDHLIAMVAVGLWAAQLGGRNRWLLPTAFLSLMMLGACLGHAGLAWRWLDSGIAASILIFGLLLAGAVRLPTFAGMAMVSGFAALHGMAHGMEIPAGASGLGYGLGFLATTTLLLTIGLGLGSDLRDSAKASRLVGATVAIAGVIAFAA
jgi:urease accessory protein